MQQGQWNSLNYDFLKMYKGFAISKFLKKHVHYKL